MSADLTAEYDRLTAELPECVRSLLAEDSGDGDEWGWVTGHRFAIAGALCWSGEDVPASWEYRPGIGPPDSDLYPDCEWFAALEDETMSGDDLRAAGDALAAYADLLRAAGLDY